MKYSLSFVFLFVVLPCVLVAQPALLQVPPGSSYGFHTNVDMEMTQSAGGQEMTVKMNLSGLGRLAAESVSKKGIDWNYSLPELHMHADQQVIPGVPTDTTVSLPAQHFSTDWKGEVKSRRVSTKGASEQSQQMMMMMLNQNNGLNGIAQYFSPLIGRSYVPGYSWESKLDDTVRNEAAGLVMSNSTFLRYTYDGLVDTLGHKLARIRSETISMKLGGKASTQGMEMVLDGDGTVYNTFYYSVSDGLLIASSTDSETHLRAGLVGMQMVIPIVQKTHSTVLWQ